MLTKNHHKIAPVFPYYGGKTAHCDWICGCMPMSADAYIEGFTGSAAIGLAQPPRNIEVWNDADPGIANLYRVIQTDSEELTRRLQYTLNSRREHAMCRTAEKSRMAGTLTELPVEWARRHIVLVAQSFAAQYAASWGYGRQSGINSFHNVPDAIAPVAMRIRNHTIENLHFEKLIEKYRDLGATVLWYFDPPYLPETRVSKSAYRCEMTFEEHTLLLTLIVKMDGMVLLSGYRSQLYDTYLTGWLRVEKDVAVLASNASSRTGSSTKPRRTECLWINPAAQEQLRKEGRL